MEYVRVIIRISRSDKIILSVGQAGVAYSNTYELEVHYRTLKLKQLFV